jgi:hypothetical protein
MKKFVKYGLISRVKCLIFILILISMSGLWANADEETNFYNGWRLSGRNSFHSNYYDSEGDPANSSYAHKFGQVYNDLSLNVEKDFSSYHRVRGNIAGVINDSKYRYDRNGFTIERFNLTQEQGETALPYRLELGDTYGFFTPRTIQKSIKGGQIEFQPIQKFMGAYNAVQVIIGDGAARDYRDSLSEDTYFGGSWLLQWKKTGLTFNYAGNKTQSNPDTSTPGLYQGVAGVAINHLTSIFSQRLEIDSEFTRFKGNPAGTGAGADDIDQGANTFFLKLAGKSIDFPITYNLRYEDYGLGYQPKGASVSQDRQIIDTNVGYQFARGLNFRLRRQFYRDNKATDNKTDTNVFGATLSGGIPTKAFPDLNMSLDTFINKSEDDNLTFQTESRSVSASFNATLIRALTGSLQLGFQDSENELTGVKSNITRSLGINLGHPLKFEDFMGSINAGMTFRSVEAPNNGDNKEPGFNLGLNLRNGGHQFDLSAYYRDFNPANAGDVLSQGSSLSYAFTTGPHSIRLDGSLSKRDPNLALSTTDYKIGLTYDCSFDLSGKLPDRKPDTRPAPTEMIAREAVSLPYTGRVITGLPPGTPMKQARTWLEKAGIASGVKTGNVHVYEARFFDTIYQRQRLALITDQSETIDFSGVIIDLVNMGGPESMGQLYNELRAVLIKQYGAPRTYEQGEFGANFFTQVNSGLFIRNAEWFTPSGILRLGIPRRLDRQVRIEVQLRKSFPGPKDTLWSMEQVR